MTISSHSAPADGISIGAGHPDIVIAVLDGPVDVAHPALATANLTIISPLPGAGSRSVECERHGTHVASQIFGEAAGGLPGLAPLCSGLVIPIYRGTAQGGLHPASQIDLARAIRTAVDRGAHIINISGGELSPTPEADQFLIDALDYAQETGVLVVAAAGNDGCDCLHLPASVASVLAVGALDPSTQKPLGFSNWGHAYRTNAILAPGKNVLGAQAGGGFVARTGTSFATPNVTGIAALLLCAAYRDTGRIDPLAIRALLLETAIPCDATQTEDCRRYLAGRLDGGAAFARLRSMTRDANPDTKNSAGTNLDLKRTREIKMQSIEGETLAAPAEHSNPAGQSRQDIPAAARAPMPQAGVAPSDARAPGGPLEAEPVSVPTAMPTAGIDPSDCGCGCGGDAAHQLVFALGKLRYDLVTEARKDSLWQAMGKNPYEWSNMVAHLEANPWDASDITWTLEIDATPIYAIQPAGPYAAQAYGRLIEILKGQLADKIERISVPGVIAGSATLTNGIVVPVIVPTMRGMYAWNTDALVKAASKAETKGKVENFLNRVYYELRSLGQSPQERAINFAATNAFQVDKVFSAAAEIGHELDTISVLRSPICRQDSDCWDVILTTFDPLNDRAARMMHRFTVDVSDVVPCTVGAVRSWSVR